MNKREYWTETVELPGPIVALMWFLWTLTVGVVTVVLFT